MKYIDSQNFEHVQKIQNTLLRNICELTLFENEIT